MKLRLVVPVAATLFTLSLVSLASASYYTWYIYPHNNYQNREILVRIPPEEFAKFQKQDLSMREFANSKTTPAKDYEVKIINRILKTKTHKEDWRIQKDFKCKNEKCKRTLSILDLFLSGVVEHGVEFMKQTVESGWGVGDVLDGNPGVRVEVRPARCIPFKCLECGTVNEI